MYTYFFMVVIRSKKTIYLPKFIKANDIGDDPIGSVLCPLYRVIESVSA